MTASDPGALRLRLRAAPGDAAAAAELARLATQTGDEAEALPLVHAAAAARTDALLWQWTAILARALDDRTLAIRAYREAAALEPANPRVRYGLARVTLEAGLPAEALFDQALALAPLDGDMLLGRASARFAAGRPDVALAEVEAVLAGNPGWLQGHDLSARFRWMLGERAGFTASLDRAIAGTPRDRMLWRRKIALQQQAEDHTAALETIAAARRTLGEPAAFRFEEAVAASETGRADADALFAPLASSAEIGVVVRHVRHLLKAQRIEQAAVRAEAHLGNPQSRLLWPYVAAAWRLLGDPRWAWLEGDPRLVSVTDLDGAGAWLAPLAERLRSLHIARGAFLDQSVRGGTQTDEALFERIDPEIAALRARIVAAVERHIAQLPPRDAAHPFLRERRDRSPRFSGSWSVRLQGGGFHVNHLHSEGWISSVFYVALPAGIGRGGAGTDGWLALGQPPRELGLALDPVRLVEPQPGRLVLFPSTMWHGTLPFAAGERLTVAFDVATPLQPAA